VTAPYPRAGTLVVRDGRVTYASEGFAALVGRPLLEIVGRSPLALVVEAERPRVEELRDRAQRGEPIPQSFELTLELPDGGRRLVECIAERDGTDLLVHARDLGAQAARRRRLDAIATAGAAIRSERSEEAVWARVRSEVEELGLAAALMRAEPSGSRLLWLSVPERLRAEFSTRMGIPPEGYVGRWTEFAAAVGAQGAAFTDDWAAHASAFLPAEHRERARAFVNRAGFTRAIAVKLERASQELIYLVVAGSWLRSDDVPPMRLFAAQVSAALDAARTISDLSRQNAHLAVLNRVAELAGDASDLPAFFARASQVIRPTAGYAGLAIFVHDEVAASLLRVHSEGTARSPAERSRGVPAESPLGEVLAGRTARVLSPPDPAANPDLGDLLSFRALALVPLVARSRAIGVLAAGFHDAGAARGVLDLLSAVGAHFASAIESHGLLSDLRRRVSELTLLNDVAQATAQLDPVVLLEAGMGRIRETIGARWAAAYLREGDRLQLLGTSGMDAERSRDMTELAAGEGPVGAALGRLAPVQAALAEVFGEPHRGTGEAAECAVVVPLVAKSQAVGALLLGRDAGTLLAPGEAALLSSIGSQLGVAVDAARLFADVRRRLSDLEAVNALALRVFENAPGDAGALLADGCHQIAQALSARAVAVFIVGDGGTTLKIAASVGPQQVPEGTVIDLARDPFSAEVIQRRAPAFSADVTRDPRCVVNGNPDVLPTATLAVPLAARGAVRGVVYVGDAPGRTFSPAEVALANALAGGLGVGMENAELYAEAQRRLEELALLNEVGRVISTFLDIGQVMREASEAARRLVGTSRAYVVLHDPVHRELRFGAGAGTPDVELHGLCFPIREGTLIERVLRERRAIAVEDAENDPIVRDVHRAALSPRALLAAPVLLRGDPLGVLVVDEQHRTRRFDAHDAERVTAIADRLAVAMENARLFEETRNRAEELGLLHEVGRSLVETLDIEQVLGHGVRNLARIVDAPAAYLALLAPDGLHLEVRAVAGAPGEPVGRRIPLAPAAADLAALVFERREPVLVDDALTDPRVSPERRASSGARAYLALPLVVRDRTIGSAVIVETRRARRFTPAEGERGAAIANQLAVAAENARLYEDLRRSYAQLARAQEQLLAGERLAALGELSAIVAHEVRNPLGVIYNSLGSLRRLVRPSGDAKMLFDIVGEEAERLNRIVGDLLDFARPSHPELRPELLGRVVEDAVAAAVAQTAAGIELDRELDPALPAVVIDARLVRQAVLNVAVNAVQAMPRGGRITIRTRREGDAALVEIEDTGSGIADEVTARIFEPFFTTKASGTGLGLAVVKRIVEGHGGAVSVRSVAGAGTVFALRFPLSPDAG
jgi:signal transduction histidine kinase